MFTISAPSSWVLRPISVENRPFFLCPHRVGRFIFFISSFFPLTFGTREVLLPPPIQFFVYSSWPEVTYTRHDRKWSQTLPLTKRSSLFTLPHPLRRGSSSEVSRFVQDGVPSWRLWTCTHSHRPLSTSWFSHPGTYNDDTTLLVRFVQRVEVSFRHYGGSE